MKELSIKEKAKLYDEAIERAKIKRDEYIRLDGPESHVPQDIEFIFPAIKESEDERIRKHIIEILSSLSPCHFDGNEKSECIAWLKKQGENKSIEEKVESVYTVYKAGDFVHCTTVNGFEYTYIYERNHGAVIHAFANYSHATSRLLSINDTLYEPSISTKRKATKEEIDTLLQAIHKQGYEWDAEEKELKEVKPDYEGMVEKFKTSVENHTEEELVEKLGIEDEEQKSVDKVEPKFKVGNWVINEHGFAMQIVDVQDSHYVYMYEGRGLSATIEQMENSCHLWTIQDSKDGDVIVTSNGNIFIFKEIRNNCHIYDHCGIYYDRLVINSCVNGTSAKELSDDYKLATKEQRDLLFQKMKEAGYEWDAKDKVLKEIEQTPTSYFYCKYGGTIPKCNGCVRNHLNSKYKTEDIKTWMTPTSRGTKQCSDYIPLDSIKWSEEDEQNLNVCLSYIPDEALRRWLTDIIHIKYLNKSMPEVNPAWSDDDKVANEYIDLGLPSGTLWKPTEEQMNAFADLLGVYFGEPQTYKTVESLYNDLKKL